MTLGDLLATGVCIQGDITLFYHTKKRDTERLDIPRCGQLFPHHAAGWIDAEVRHIYPLYDKLYIELYAKEDNE